ncbi:ferritin [Candidatus Babeliales bacterium]|nr:ferritin [Candidatus Babeliales bacterium]
MSTSLVTKFSEKCVKATNNQINAELNAGYVYHALSIYFSRHDVALPNVAAFFKRSSVEEQEHAGKLIDYLNQRGGQVVLSDIQAPKITNVSLLQAFEKALVLEKDVHKKLIALRELSDKEGEYHFTAYLEEDFLTEQIRAEHDLVSFITTIKRMGTGLGEVLFDRELAAK